MDLWKNIVFSCRLFIFCLSLATALATSVASELQINGFGTVGAAASDDQSGYAYDIRNKINYYHDTKFGLNFSSRLGQKWSWASQLLVKRWVDDTFDDNKVKLDWALVSYHPWSDLSFRVGKQKLPLWLFSDYAEVGFLYPWVRPIQEVYGITPLNTITGASLNYIKQLGTVNFELNAVAGDSKVVEDRNGGIVLLANVKRAQLLTFSLIHENFLLKANLGKSDAVDVTQRTGSSSYVFPQLKYTFASLGAKVDYQTHFVWTEIVTTHVEHLSNMNGLYLSYGKKFGIFSPHITYARYWSHNYKSVRADTTTSTATTTVRVLSYVPERKNKQQSLILGLVTKITDRSNFKLEWQYIDADGYSRDTTERSTTTGGVTTTVTSHGNTKERGFFDAHPRGEVNLFSATINFIF
ncbi:MAG: hypothetical protein HQK50_06315 [Oligoflexia bacterium]|nr:hypothetical protein [Oligoflexia bacterium]MBF0365165.1 hypothetical protein [Oligoflexia bacterium]